MCPRLNAKKLATFFIAMRTSPRRNSVSSEPSRTILESSSRTRSGWTITLSCLSTVPRSTTLQCRKKTWIKIAMSWWKWVPKWTMPSSSPKGKHSYSTRAIGISSVMNAKKILKVNSIQNARIKYANVMTSTVLASGPGLKHVRRFLMEYRTRNLLSSWMKNCWDFKWKNLKLAMTLTEPIPVWLTFKIKMIDFKSKWFQIKFILCSYSEKWHQ